MTEAELLQLENLLARLGDAATKAGAPFSVRRVNGPEKAIAYLRGKR